MAKCPIHVRLNQMAESAVMEYVYLGDRMTDEKLKGKKCKAVRRSDGKCIRVRLSMLVEFENGRRCTVIAPMLRKIKK